VDRTQLDVTRPTYVDALGGIRIALVAAGGSHSVVVSTDGAAYGFGCGLDGQLGSGVAHQKGGGGGGGGGVDAGRCSSSSSAGRGSGSGLPAGLGASSAVPLLLEGAGLEDEEVVQAACGGRHTLLRCTSGALYACGWNRYGQCCCCCCEASSSSSPSAAGLAHAWGCVHGEAIYAPLRLRLHAPRSGEQRPSKLQRLVEAEASSQCRASQVFAGTWHSVVQFDCEGSC